MDFSSLPYASDSSRPLCHCLGVAKEEVRSCIEEESLTSVRGVTKACGAGGGCTSCHRHIKRLLHEHALQQRGVATDAVPAFGYA